MWNRNTIENVTFTFKEPFGTDGRGGYFDHYGIIRDILQNHLLQVLSIFAMEPPEADDGDAIRNAKTEVLRNMDPIRIEDTLLGQYDGYTDDPTIENKDTNCPTYAALRCWIHTPRWEGVPFILQAGKARCPRQRLSHLTFLVRLLSIRPSHRRRHVIKRAEASPGD